MTDDDVPVALDHDRQDLEPERVELRLSGRVVMHILLDVRYAMTREEILRLSAARSAVVRINADLFVHLSAHLPRLSHRRHAHRSRWSWTSFGAGP